MSKGIDVSHWQGTIDWSKVTADFAFIKATQGQSWVDNHFEKNKKGAAYKGLLKGYYHFADGTDPIKEADHFIKTIGTMDEGDLLCLDYEINMAGAGNWCRRFLDRCFAKTGVRPLLYTNEARVKAIDWKEVVDGNYALWVAKYGLNLPVMGPVKPSSGQWKFWLIWQYTSKGSMPGVPTRVDLNHSDYPVDILRKYGKKPSCDKCCKIHCPQ